MQIDVMPMGRHEFAVNLTEGHETTAHRVVVSEDLLDAAPTDDEPRLVRASMQIFLDHKKATNLPHDVSLDWVADTVAGFSDELAARLT
jgi:hypothetical protein